MIVRSRAPLRLGLAGGGTDISSYFDKYGDGKILNTTINLYAHCTIEKNNHKNVIEFLSIERNTSFVCNSEKRLEILADDQYALHKATYNKIIELFSLPPLSIKMITYIDVPFGSGLGTSSTMIVAMIKAYQEYLNLPLGEYDIAHIAYEIERIDLGLTGGKQDQYAATFGGFNFMEFSKNDVVIVNPLRIKENIINELEDSMFLYYTGISRESSKVIDEQKTNILKSKPTTIRALDNLVDDAIKMKDALLRGNILLFAEYLNKSWEHKKMVSSSISTPLIDEIYSYTMTAGAYGGKISGAGGGGFISFICDPIRKKNIKNELFEVYKGIIYDIKFVDSGCQSWRI